MPGGERVRAGRSESNVAARERGHTGAMEAVASRARRLGGLPWRTPPQGLFVIGAVTQYVGAGLAVLLFARVPAAGVAWLRVLTAAVVLVAWRRPWGVLAVDGAPGGAAPLRVPDAVGVRGRVAPLSRLRPLVPSGPAGAAVGTRGPATATARDRAARRSRLWLLVSFGLVLGGMNTTFYLAIDRLPLGTAVALEFLGPIAVTVAGSRTRRDLGALALAVAGVVLLSDVHLAGNALGVALALAAGVLWAGYIVLGHRVAADPALDRGRGLAVAMAVAAVALAPFSASSAAHALLSPGLLAACVGVGLASSVIPYALDQVAMARLSRARFALLLALLPATATLVGIVVLGQVPGPLEVVGIGCVVAATALRTHDD